MPAKFEDARKSEWKLSVTVASQLREKQSYREKSEETKKDRPMKKPVRQRQELKIEHPERFVNFAENNLQLTTITPEQFQRGD